jgi:hypothetical protein
MTERNKEIRRKVDLMKENGFSFSCHQIALFLTNKNIAQPDGIPYDRNSVTNKIRSAISTDHNIENAVNEVFLAVRKGSKRIWKYHQKVGAPVKKKKPVSPVS